MKTQGRIVYYTLNGYTEAVAQLLQKQTAFEVSSLKEVKDRPRNNIMGAAMGAFFGLKSRLHPVDYSNLDVEALILCVPIWAGKTTPAFNTYLSKANLKAKEVYLVVTKADPNDQPKFLENVAQRIERKGGLVRGHLYLTNPSTLKETVKVDEEALEETLKQWLTTL